MYLADHFDTEKRESLASDDGGLIDNFRVGHVCHRGSRCRDREGDRHSREFKKNKMTIVINFRLNCERSNRAAMLCVDIFTR